MYNQNIKYRCSIRHTHKGEITMTYSMNIAGLQRELPICKVNDEL